MPLSRNSIARNMNIHNRIKTLDIVKTKRKLESIMEKHGIFELPFCDCKIVNNDGIIFNVKFEKIRGNLRSGVFIINAKSICQIENVIYDLVEIGNKKNKKKDINNDKNASTVKDDIELSDIPDPSVISSIEENYDSTDNPETVESSQNKQKNCVEILTGGNDTSKKDNLEKDNISQEKNKTKNNKMNEKKENAIRKMQNALGKKLANIEKGNKYLRKTVKDIKSNYKLEKWDYKYFEVKVETSYMVIENVQLYRILIPNNIDFVHLLIIGELQMKNELIKRIDPTHQMEKIFGEQNDIIGKIIENENSGAPTFVNTLSNSDDKENNNNIPEKVTNEK